MSEKLKKYGSKPTYDELEKAIDTVNDAIYYLEKHEPYAKNEIRILNETVTILGAMQEEQHLKEELGREPTQKELEISRQSRDEAQE